MALLANSHRGAKILGMGVQVIKRLDLRIWFAAWTAIFCSGLAFGSDRIPGEYLVRYKEQASAIFRSGLVDAPTGFKVLADHPVGKWLHVSIRRADEKAVLARLQKLSDVVYVVGNYRVHSFDSSLSNLRSTVDEQWALKKVHAREAWQRTGNFGSRKVVVGVIDSGADPSHPDLVGNLVPGYNFVEGNTDTTDVTNVYGNKGHGTHCSGIVGARGVVCTFGHIGNILFRRHR